MLSFLKILSTPKIRNWFDFLPTPTATRLQHTENPPPLSLSLSQIVTDSIEGRKEGCQQWYCSVERPPYLLLSVVEVDLNLLHPLTSSSTHLMVHLQTHHYPDSSVHGELLLTMGQFYHPKNGHFVDLFLLVINQNCLQNLNLTTNLFRKQLLTYSFLGEDYLYSLLATLVVKEQKGM